MVKVNLVCIESTILLLIFLLFADAIEGVNGVWNKCVCGWTNLTVTFSIYSFGRCSVAGGLDLDYTELTELYNIERTYPLY